MCHVHNLATWTREQWGSHRPTTSYVQQDYGPPSVLAIPTLWRWMRSRGGTDHVRLLLGGNVSPRPAGVWGLRQCHAFVPRPLRGDQPGPLTANIVVWHPPLGPNTYSSFLSLSPKSVLSHHREKAICSNVGTLGVNVKLECLGLSISKKVLYFESRHVCCTLHPFIYHRWIAFFSPCERALDI